MSPETNSALSRIRDKISASRETWQGNVDAAIAKHVHGAQAHSASHETVPVDMSAIKLPLDDKAMQLLAGIKQAHAFPVSSVEDHGMQFAGAKELGKRVLSQA